MSEYPIRYEQVAGASISPRWRGRDVPVPPTWVRNRTDVPQRMKFACLSADLADTLPRSVRPVLVDYVKNWLSVAESGTDLLITGRVPNYRRLWAGAAVVNEIVMRYSNWSGLSVGWLAIRGLHWMMDAKEKGGGDAYLAMRNRMLSCKLLLVEDLFQLPPSSNHRWFLESLYQQRFDNKLCTITTLNTELGPESWKVIQKLVGAPITEILQNNHEPYWAEFPRERS